MGVGHPAHAFSVKGHDPNRRAIGDGLSVTGGLKAGRKNESPIIAGTGGTDLTSDGGYESENEKYQYGNPWRRDGPAKHDIRRYTGGEPMKVGIGKSLASKGVTCHSITEQGPYHDL
jgi:hypothetical protein